MGTEDTAEEVVVTTTTRASVAEEEEEAGEDTAGVTTTTPTRAETEAPLEVTRPPEVLLTRLRVFQVMIILAKDITLVSFGNHVYGVSLLVITKWTRCVLGMARSQLHFRRVWNLYSL